MDIKVKEKAAQISMASTEANPEGTDSWRLSANYSLSLKGKLFLVGIQSGAPPWLPVY